MWRNRSQPEAAKRRNNKALGRSRRQDLRGRYPEGAQDPVHSQNSALDEYTCLPLCSRLMNRRTFLHGTLAGAATLAVSRKSLAADADLAPVWTQIEKN